MLALLVAGSSLAFNEPAQQEHDYYVYVFDLEGLYLTQGYMNEIDDWICPGNEIPCAQVWTEMIDWQPSGYNWPDLLRSF